MANSYTNVKGRTKTGGFVQLYKSVINRPEFYNLSTKAIKLIIDMISVYNGSNNGDICTTWSMMKKRGWKSRETLDTARAELIDTGFIVLSRQGGKNLASLYAVTFYPIDDCKGKLDIKSTNVAPNNWKK